jgi:hypothetical protein
MQVEKIAQAVKDYIVALAINDELPMDLNDLSVEALEEVIKSQLPTSKEKAIDKASELLSYDSHEELVSMVEAIANHEDQTELIDYVDGVCVWEKVELEFTCEQFLEQIGY